MDSGKNKSYSNWMLPSVQVSSLWITMESCKTHFHHLLADIISLSKIWREFKKYWQFSCKILVTYHTVLLGTSHMLQIELSLGMSWGSHHV